MGASSGPRPRRSAFAFLVPVRVIEMKQPSWRSVLPIHPAAELFPRMPPDERRVLGEDIRKHGLREPVVLQRQYRRRADGSIANEHDYKLVLLDGISRLDSMEEADFPLVRDGKLDKTLGHAALGLKPLTDGAYAELDPGIDPYDFVVSRNILRRHLNAKQRRELIAKLLKADASKSDRQIGEMIKADHKTVGAVRAEKEATGEISSVEKRIGMDGKARKRPAKKNRRRGQSEAVAAAAMIAEHDAIMRDIRGNDADPEGSAKKRGAHYAEMEDEHDRDIELDIYPDNSRNAFLIRVNQVIEFATYSGPVTGE